MLNPTWLKSFATVAACHSFTAAARQLGLTQSSVSDHIRRLEQEIGRRLFVRDTHTLAITPDGEAMLAHAGAILQAINRAESQFRAPRLKGRVRLGSSDDIALGPLPTVLTAFRNAHPDVELEIIIGMTGRLYELLDAGAIDLMVGKRRLGDKRGVALFTGRLEWLARTGTMVDLTQPLPLNLVAEPSVTRAVVLDALAQTDFRWQIVCTSSSHSGCVAAARGGLGITVRPQYLAARGLAPPLNVASLPVLPDVEFIALAAKRLSRPAQTLMQLLHDSDLRGSWIGE
ncbi:MULTISPECIES: LysR family transcriptional regulator [Paraburkholderia]|uniref:LysR family transcriptional regulator n=1 Tax=Paraburkholderia tropica TaxID=92647 RepID=A0AAQ1JWM5_9BURK|nr:LysR family transcriptional regulator [Paraburkholderia tropica]MBB3003568.1 DNA-binding transcriptional LysR family regulator [Paraburkholderia tropica]MBB6322522.1 DNA-binding transcriptional LysR family regulator [Paraburkholderia tropica]MDE1144014.1 LysR family transcriptional regulator [Paraburkholderia tropica]PXX11483.1 LysR family transcriptional regulator [Paraburkholderia tropica]PZW76146.1 LysR family transcriptional regulator [Paraburkholderia tropica]